MPGIQINGVLDVRWPSLIDKRSGKLVGSVSVPYDTFEEVFAVETGITEAYRAEGLVVFIRNPEDAAKIDWWQFQGGVQEENLIKIIFASSSSISNVNLKALIASGDVSNVTIYELTDNFGGSISINSINTSLQIGEGLRVMKVPTTYALVTDDNGNVWKGIFNPAGTYAVDDLAIWGGAVWKKITGSDPGTPTDRITLDAAQWVAVSRETFTNGEYIDMSFRVTYDIDNDWIVQQSDFFNNVIGTTKEYGVLNGYDLPGNPVDYTDWNFFTGGRQIMNCTAAFGIFNNRLTGDITDNVCPTGEITGNVTDTPGDGQGFIRENRVNYGILDNTCSAIESNFATRITLNVVTDEGAAITRNILGNGGIEENTAPGGIYGNMILGNITANTITGYITKNHANEITGNNNTGNIEGNHCGIINGNFNAGDISFNHCTDIQSNENNGGITYNRNNGTIDTNTSVNPCNIHHNVNNGNISAALRATHVTDTAVNK